MKKTPLLITVGIVVLSAVSYFSYVYLYNKEGITFWDLVPENAVAVYESGPCKECIDESKKSVVGDLIQKSTFYQKGTDSLRNILNLINFPTEGTLVSLHVIKKDEFDFVFYVPIKNKRERNFLDNVLGGWSENKSYKYSEREFSAIKIQQLTGAEFIMSWFFLEDKWVFSFTPYLVEDVIRTYHSDAKTNFKNNVSSIFHLPKIQTDAGNLYVHFTKLSELLNVFGDQDSNTVKQLGNSILLDVKTSPTGIVLNGFSSDKAGSIFSIFNRQVPVPLGIRNLISNRAVMLANYGISDGLAFGADLKAYGKTNTLRKSYNDTLRVIDQSLSFETDLLYNAIENEIAVCYFETKDVALEKIVLIETSDSRIWLEQLNKASEKLSMDTVFFERFSEYEIRELPLSGFADKLFFPIVSATDQTFYTSINNVILLSGDIEALKRFLSDVDQEETWGRSVSQNQFLETTLLESNISVYVNTPKIWNSISKNLHPRWKKFISDNPAIIQSLNMGAIQFSHLNESFYTNVSWQFSSSPMASEKVGTRARTSVNFSAPLLDKLVIGKNHVDKSNEIFVQDSTYSIHLISNEGKELWNKSIHTPILGDIYQIDYYKNGKLQYLFATANMLHLVDRLGNYVESYPKSIPLKDISFFTIVDYDHSKNYRFLISDHSGKLWMFDKTGKNLEGWNPRNAGDVLSIQPRHFRVRGKDYLLAIKKDGEIYLMNRRGELYPKFPLKTESRPLGDFFVDIGKTSANTFIVLVTDGGYRIRISLDGVIESRETLIRTEVNSRFKMITDPSRQTYIFTRQENSKLSIFSHDAKLIIENSFLGDNEASVAYYDFGAGNTFITVTDNIQGISFVYTGTGTLLTKSPIQGTKIRVSLEAGRPKIYYSNDKELVIQDL